MGALLSQQKGCHLQAPWGQDCSGTATGWLQRSSRAGEVVAVLLKNVVGGK